MQRQRGIVSARAALVLELMVGEARTVSQDLGNREMLSAKFWLRTHGTRERSVVSVKVATYRGSSSWEESNDYKAYVE